jgi:hypothetical protein
MIIIGLSIVFCLIQASGNIDISKKTTISEVFKIASEITGDTYIAPGSIQQQRVVLSLKNKNPGEFRNIILQTLNHREEKKFLFEWEIIQNNQKTEYHLVKSQSYKTIENKELAYPYDQVRIILQKSHSHLAESDKDKNQDKEAYFAANDNRYLAQAIKRIDQSSIDMLINNSYIEASNLIPPEGIALYKKEYTDQINSSKALSTDQKKTAISNIEKEKPYLYLFQSPENEYQFRLGLSGVFTSQNEKYISAVGICTDQNTENSFFPLSDIPESIRKIDNTQIIDLSKELNNKNSTEEQRKDRSFILLTLAKKTGIQISEEHFLKSEYAGLPYRKSEFPLKKGTLRNFFLEIWKKWQVKTDFHNEVYYVWSPTWVFDRKCDISDDILNKWKNLYKLRQGFSIEDQSQIALSLSDSQIIKTFNLEVPSSLPTLDISNHLSTLRFMGCLSKKQWEKCRSPQGMTWEEAPQKAKSMIFFTEMQKNFPPKFNNNINFENISNSSGTVHIRSRKDDTSIMEMLILNVYGRDGVFLFMGGAQGSYLLKDTVPSSLSSL